MSISVSKKHTFLATSSTDNTLRIWTVSSPSLLYSFNLSSPACSIALPEYFDSKEEGEADDSEGPVVLISTLSGSLSTIEFSKNLHRTLLSATPKAPITHIGYISSKRLLVTLTSNSLKVYQFGTHLDLKQIYEFEILDTKTCALGTFKMTEEVVVGDEEGAVRVFDLSKMELVKETRAQDLFGFEEENRKFRVLGIKVRWDDQGFFVAYQGGRVGLFDENNEFRRCLYGKTNCCCDLIKSWLQ